MQDEWEGKAAALFEGERDEKREVEHYETRCLLRTETKKLAGVRLTKRSWLAVPVVIVLVIVLVLEGESVPWRRRRRFRRRRRGPPTGGGEGVVLVRYDACVVCPPRTATARDQRRRLPLARRVARQPVAPNINVIA